jgi:hypothetical protein
MGLIEFFILVIVVVVLAALTVWAIGQFAPGTPAIVPRLIWGVAVVIIIFTLVQALGLMGHDPQIPRLR